MDVNELVAFSIGERFGSPWGQGDFTLGKFVGLVVQWAIIIAGVVMIFLIVGGGFMFMLGAGQGNPETAAKGKKAVTSALFGFIIIITAYLIVSAIELMLGTNSILTNL